MTARLPSVEEALERLAREDRSRVVAILARRFGDLDLADEASQDALLDAMRTWPEQGVPDNPAAWLLSVARRRAIDRLRRAGSADRRTKEAAPDLVTAHEQSDSGGLDMIDDDGTIADERLRLILLCCHPALNRDAQVALTLRLVGGLTTPEIAAAFLVPEPTLAQRIVRAKQKIRLAQIPMAIPADLDDRIDSILTVLYLIFNEGYLSHSEDAGAVRLDLTDEAIRLTRVVMLHAPDHPEIAGLLALQLYLQARAATRVDGTGELVLLANQDRSGWDLDRIEDANDTLRSAMRLMKPGRYQVEATIASLHANARTSDDTDWPTIAALYGQLVAMTGSSVIELNRAVAIAMADGPHAGLRAVHAIDGLDDYHHLHATIAELESRAGNRDAARVAFEHALTLAERPAERRHLERRIADHTAA